MSAWLATLALFAVTAVFTFVMGTRATASPRSMARLFGAGIARPAAARAGRQWQEFLSAAASLAAAAADPAGLRRRFLRAGICDPKAVEWYRGAQVVAALSLGMAALAGAAGGDLSSSNTIATVLGAALVGFRAPSVYLARRRRRRVREIERTLPNAVDLLIVCVESGLGLDQATRLVARELGDAHAEISREFTLLHGEIAAGQSRADALRRLADRTGIDEVRDLVSALIQADRFGASICQTLRTRSEFMRVQARHKAEEKAAKLGVKLIFPIFFCVLPTLFLVTLGPAIFQLIAELLPVINNM